MKLTPENEAKIAQIAEKHGKTPEEILNQLVDQFSYLLGYTPTKESKKSEAGAKALKLADEVLELLS